MKIWTIYLECQKPISVKESMTSITRQLKLSYFLMEILINTRTDIFVGTLVIKMVKWDGVIVLKLLQISLDCLTLFHIMEANRIVHIHLATRYLILGTS